MNPVLIISWPFLFLLSGVFVITIPAVSSFRIPRLAFEGSAECRRYSGRWCRRCCRCCCSSCCSSFAMTRAPCALRGGSEPPLVAADAEPADGAPARGGAAGSKVCIPLSDPRAQRRDHPPLPRRRRSPRGRAGRGRRRCGGGAVGLARGLQPGWLDADGDNGQLRGVGRGDRGG